MKRIFVIILISLIVGYVLRGLLGITGINFFLFIDNSLMFSPNINPVILWGVLGLFTGLIYGNWVAVKKYNLNFKLSFIYIGAIVLFFALGVVVNQSYLIPFTSTANSYETGYNFITVTASGNVASVGKTNYSAENLIDNNDRTAWLYVNQGNGNDHINFVFSADKINKLKELKCVGLRIQNGYDKSYTKWQDFGKILSYTIYYNDKVISDGVAKSSFMVSEDIRFSPIAIAPNDSITVKINSIIEGGKKGSRLCAISEFVPLIVYSKD